MICVSAPESTPYHNYYINCEIQSFPTSAGKYFHHLGYGIVYIGTQLPTKNINHPDCPEGGGSKLFWNAGLC